MTKKEKLLAAKFLRLASDEFSNHGCNDLEPEITEHFTDTEKIEFARKIHKWNGDPEEFDGTINSFNRLPDWYFMIYLSNLIEKESN